MLQQHLSYQQFYCLLRCDLYKRFYGSLADLSTKWSKTLAITSHGYHWHILSRCAYLYRAVGAGFDWVFFFFYKTDIIWITLDLSIGLPWWSKNEKPIGWLIPFDIMWHQITNQLCARISSWCPVEQLGSVPRTVLCAPCDYFAGYRTIIVSNDPGHVTNNVLLVSISYIHT